MLLAVHDDANPEDAVGGGVLGPDVEDVWLACGGHAGAPPVGSAGSTMHVVAVEQTIGLLGILQTGSG